MIEREHAAARGRAGRSRRSCAQRAAALGRSWIRYRAPVGLDVVGDDERMGVHRVVPDLSCTSLESATAFYGHVLGLQPVMDHGWIVTLADPEAPHAQVSLLTHDATAPVISRASIQVDDVDACHAAAVRAGAEIVHPLTDEPWGVSSLLCARPRRACDQRPEPPIAPRRSRQSRSAIPLRRRCWPLARPGRSAGRGRCGGGGHGCVLAASISR